MQKRQDPPPKIYVPGEERLNIWSHGLGTILSVAGTIWLLCMVKTCAGAVSAVIYGVSLCVLFAGSALYHAAKDPAVRAKRRLVDHSAIYFLIAGTYTPLMIIGVPDVWGLSVMGAVWLLGIIGVTLELMRLKPFKGFSILLYILMGWACMAILPKLLAAIPPTAFHYLLWGGVAYTAGVPFYIWRKNYSHALWHIFVLAGALLHFLAILTIARG